MTPATTSNIAEDILSLEPIIAETAIEIATSDAPYSSTIDYIP
jgi:hypothetical protein